MLQHFFITDRHVGQLNDVYRYLEAHYIILDSDLLERIEIIEGPEYTGSSLDGTSAM